MCIRDSPQARGKLGTTHARHELIGDDEIKTRRPRLECLEGLRSVGHDGGEALLALAQGRLGAFFAR